MKVRAHFPTACRAEQAVHAPPERPSGWHMATAALSTSPSTMPKTIPQERSLSGAPLRRSRAFPTTRPHPGGSASHYGIGP